MYGTHYHRDIYPTGAMDELCTEAIAWLNDDERMTNTTPTNHHWDFQDGDFGLWPTEDDDYPS